MTLAPRVRARSDTSTGGRTTGEYLAEVLRSSSSPREGMVMVDLCPAACSAFGEAARVALERGLLGAELAGD